MLNKEVVKKESRTVVALKFGKLVFGSILFGIPSAFYWLGNQHALYQDISYIVTTIAFLYFYFGNSKFKHSNPIAYWSTTVTSMCIFAFVSLSLIPVYFSTASLSLPYMLMAATSIIAGLIAYFCGWYYFNKDKMLKNIHSEGMLRPGFHEGNSQVSMVIFQAFRPPENVIMQAIIKISRWYFLAFAMLSVFLGGSVGFIILNIAKQIVPEGIAIAPHPIVIFSVCLPLLTAMMVYVRPMQEFTKLWLSLDMSAS